YRRRLDPVQVRGEAGRARRDPEHALVQDARARGRALERLVLLVALRELGLHEDDSLAQVLRQPRRDGVHELVRPGGQAEGAGTEVGRAVQLVAAAGADVRDAGLLRRLVDGLAGRGRDAAGEEVDLLGPDQV